MTEIETLEEVKKKAVLLALSKTKTAGEAAKALGISRATLYRLMSTYGIKRGELECHSH